MKLLPAVFEEREIRRVYDEKTETWFFSVVDIYIVTDCDYAPRLQDPIRDPARLDWNEVTKVAHYYLSVNVMTKPMLLRDSPPYGGKS